MNAKNHTGAKTRSKHFLHYLALTALFFTITQTSAGSPLRLIAPTNGEIVPLLNEKQKEFLDMSRADRVSAYTNATFRTALKKEAGEIQKPLVLEWEGDAPGGVGTVFTVEVRRRKDGLPVFRADTTDRHVIIDNLEIACEYDWTVWARGLETVSAAGSFKTEDRPPRLIRGGKVPNVRDLGGRIGLGGRRVRQGLVFRSAGLNSNASAKFSTREEMLASSPDPSALLARETALSNSIVAMKEYQANPKRLNIVSIIAKPDWKVFRTTLSDDRFQAEGIAALLSLSRVPEEFLGAVAQCAPLNSDSKFAFSENDRQKAMGPAVFMNEFEALSDGWAVVGCGADWWWKLIVNGEIVFDRSMTEGNAINPVSASNYTFIIPVKKGRNFIAAPVKSGAAGWVWSCAFSPAVPLATALAGSVANAQTRLDSLFRVQTGMLPGVTRIDSKNRSLWLDTLGIRTDIDLRSESECWGMDCSPLGPGVKWVNVSSGSYGGMQKEFGRDAFAKVFSVFLDPANYPIVFHCIAGQDRTGAVAFILGALLGFDEEALWLDWEETAFHNPSTSFNHERLFNHLWNGFDRWPGATIHDRVAAYVRSLGFTDSDIETLRAILLEPEER